MKYPAFALLLFIILQNISCTTGNKYVKETQTLDSLQILVGKADSTVKMIDSIKITGYANNVMKDMQLINMWHVDSMSSGAAAIFRSFSAVRWALLTDAGKRRPLLIELEKSQKQLGHLSHDLKHNLVTSDSVKFYVTFESQKATELMQVSVMSVNDISRQLPLYNAIAPQADSLISLLKDHKKI